MASRNGFTLSFIVVPVASGIKISSRICADEVCVGLLDLWGKTRLPCTSHAPLDCPQQAGELLTLRKVYTYEYPSQLLRNPGRRKP